MKTIFILLFLIAQCEASQIVVDTGFGYLKDAQGNITDKEQLPVGQHYISDGYTYFEVGTREELDSIKLYYENSVDEIEVDDGIYN